MNLYRCTPDGSLDRKYLRTCAVYRLLKKARISKARGLELLVQRHGASQARTMRALIELWLSGPLRGISLPAEEHA